MGKAWSKTKVFILDGLLRPVRPIDMIRLGTYYGGWWIPKVDPNDGPAVCVGAGMDVSFDLELQRLGYAVYSVDPTPAAVEYVETRHPDLRLVPVGVGPKHGNLTFKQGETWRNSWSIAKVPGPNTITLPVVTVKELLESLGVDRPAILKLDIEGVEHEVIRSVVEDKVRPGCLCVEFDDNRMSRVLRTVRLLRSYGYRLLQIEGWNFIFVH